MSRGPTYRRPPASPTERTCRRHLAEQTRKIAMLADHLHDEVARGIVLAEVSGVRPETITRLAYAREHAAALADETAELTPEGRVR
jgi:hypothetical protein